MVTFKDHFSGHSRQYTQFRPHYPRELFTFLVSLVARRERAWDCGTGNGQAADGLAEFFAEVVATDLSPQQIAAAPRCDRVAYLVAPAERCPLGAESVDLIAVAQAVHWFDLDRFYDEVRRVGRRSSVLAVWTYGLFQITPEIDQLVEHFYGKVVGAYWPPERRLVEERYATIPFPFDEVPVPELAIEADWDLDSVLGYLGTWSAVQKFIERHGADPVTQIVDALRAKWGDARIARRIRWPLHVRAGRVK